MKKKYLIEFTHTDGRIEEVELTTDRIEWSIEQWSRNRSIKSHKIISEGKINPSSILFG